MQVFKLLIILVCIIPGYCWDLNAVAKITCPLWNIDAFSKCTLQPYATPTVHSSIWWTDEGYVVVWQGLELEPLWECEGPDDQRGQEAGDQHQGETHCACADQPLGPAEVTQAAAGERVLGLARLLVKLGLGVLSHHLYDISADSFGSGPQWCHCLLNCNGGWRLETGEGWELRALSVSA